MPVTNLLSTKILKLTVAIFLLLLTSACFEKYSDAGIHSAAEWMIPFASGTYSIDELFDLSEEEKVQAAGQGSFYQFRDTLLLKHTMPQLQSDSLGLVIESVNYLPFEIVLIIQPFDTIQHRLSGDSIQFKLARAAAAGDDLWQTVPAGTRNYLLLEGELETWFSEAGALLLTADFIWPHDESFALTISELPDINVLDLQLFFNLKF